jgi:hypothetical protein
MATHAASSTDATYHGCMNAYYGVSQAYTGCGCSLDVYNLDDRRVANAMEGHNGVVTAAVTHTLGVIDGSGQDLISGVGIRCPTHTHTHTHARTHTHTSRITYAYAGGVHTGIPLECATRSHVCECARVRVCVNACVCMRVCTWRIPLRGVGADLW